MLVNHDLTPQKRRPWYTRLLRAFGVLMATLILLLGGVSGLLYLYQDDIKAAVINELNAHLKAEIRISPQDIDLTFIRSFPNCSVQFRDVLMYEALKIKQRDTLLFASQLDLQLSLRELWNKHYSVRALKLQGAVIKMRVLKTGQVNYEFWQKDTTQSASVEQTTFNLERFDLLQSRFSYRDARSGLSMAVGIPELALSGRFSDSNYSLATEGQLFIRQIAHANQTYLKEKDLDFSIHLDVKGPQYTFTKTRVQLNTMKMVLSGGFVMGDSLRQLRVDVEAPDLDIASALSLLPQRFRQHTSDYRSEGRFYAKAHIDYSPERATEVSAQFGINNGQITYVPNGATAEQVSLKGRLEMQNGKSELSLQDIHLRLKNDDVRGSLLIENFQRPNLNAVLQTDLDLFNLQEFLAIDTLRSLKGRLAINAKINGNLDELKRQTFSDKVQVDVVASVSGLELGFRGDEKVFSAEKGVLTAKERNVEVTELQIRRGSSDLLINGSLPGFFNYLAGQGGLVIKGDLRSEYIRLEDFMVKYKASGGEGPIIPKGLEFLLHADIGRLTYAHFEAQQLAGELEIKNQRALVSDMQLSTMGGKARLDAFADNSHRGLEVTLQAELNAINISSLFSQLDNFGQTTLRDNNIKGIATAQLEFSGSWSNSLQADLRSMRAVCGLKVERGELVDFKPLLGLSRFVDISDLQRVKFSDLTSTVKIRDGKIEFPKTVINNSALNLEFWGTHGFDNAIEYHIRLLINDLLAKKRKNRNDEEFGVVQNDPENRRSAFVLMTGTVDEPKFSYDKRGLREKVREDLKSEKTDIRRVLREEFGLFKKDSLTRRDKKSETTFELEKPAGQSTKKTLEPKRKPEDDDF